MKRLISILFLLGSVGCNAVEPVEAPIFAGAEVVKNESMESSKKGVMHRQVILRTKADVAEVRRFYEGRSAIKGCRENPMGNNYRCEFAAEGKIRSGDLFVSKDERSSSVEILMDYFYNE